MAEQETDNAPSSDKSDYFTLFADANFSAFLEAEVKYRVREQLRVRQFAQNAIIGVALLVACVGLAIAGNAYLRLQDTRAKNDQLATTLTKINAVLKVAISPEAPTKASTE